MFSYVSLGTADLARAIRFYDAVLEPLGHRRIEDFDTEATSAASPTSSAASTHFGPFFARPDPGWR